MKLLSLLLVTVFSLSASAARVDGIVDYKNGKWQCSATNDTNGSVYVSSVYFYGEKRRDGFASKFVSVKRTVAPGETITVSRSVLLPVDRVLSCYFHFRY